MAAVVLGAVASILRKKKVLAGALRAIKVSLDPKQVLNPGKLLPEAD